MCNTVNFIINIVIALGGLAGFYVYWRQNKNRKIEAAASIVTQIEDIKDKLLSINNISDNNKINEKAIYETLDILTDNQWEKYRHIFIRIIDSDSFRRINKFYECVLSIREQLMLAKKLQHQHYFNLQELLFTDCNTFLLSTMDSVKSNSQMQNLRDEISKKETHNEDEEKNKTVFIGILDELQANPNYEVNNFWKIYNSKISQLKDIINQSPIISYIPLQISQTLNEQLKNVNSLEVIGCEGFRKLKKIAKKD